MSCKIQLTLYSHFTYFTHFMKSKNVVNESHTGTYENKDTCAFSKDWDVSVNQGFNEIIILLYSADV